MILSDGEVRAMSALALAHMGDAVYEILARREVCRFGKLTAGELHRQTILTEPELTSISSTIVRELLQFGKDVTPFLPEGMKID